MWNSISSSVQKEIGNITALRLLLLSGNQISGPLPEELGYLPNLSKFQLDLNAISGPIPKSFAKLPKVVHFHMNNNSINGQIPPEFSALPLQHFLLDNNLSGYLPPELAQMPSLKILQLDTNNFEGSVIPASYSNMSKLLKLSLRNCNLQGTVPDLSTIPGLLYLNLQRNLLSDISRILDPPPNVDIMLYGNPVCGIANEHQIIQFCKSNHEDEEYGSLNNSIPSCSAEQPCNKDFEHVPALMDDCFCAAPFGVGLHLRSPSISDFPPHRIDFEQWITKSVNLDYYQLFIQSVAWESDPRLGMFLKFYPPRTNDSRINDFGKFNDSEIVRIANKFALFNLTGTDIFGPYDLLNFTAMGYSSVLLPPVGVGKGGSRISRATLVGIILGSLCAAAVILTAIAFVLLKMRWRFHVSKDQPSPKFPMRIQGVKAFGFKELEAAASSFSSTTEIGQGGYGKVYKGILAEGTIVAIKRAHQGSLQGKKSSILR